jgi:hypothetical protein
VYTEVSSVLSAVAAYFYYNCRCLEIRSNKSVRYGQCASAGMRKTLDWKRSRIKTYLSGILSSTGATYVNCNEWIRIDTGFYGLKMTTTQIRITGNTLALAAS